MGTVAERGNVGPNSIITADLLMSPTPPPPPSFFQTNNHASPHSSSWVEFRTKAIRENKQLWTLIHRFLRKKVKLVDAQGVRQYPWGRGRVNGDLKLL